MTPKFVIFIVVDSVLLLSADILLCCCCRLRLVVTLLVHQFLSVNLSSCRLKQLQIAQIILNTSEMIASLLPRVLNTLINTTTHKSPAATTIQSTTRTSEYIRTAASREAMIMLRYAPYTSWNLHITIIARCYCIIRAKHSIIPQ